MQSTKRCRPVSSESPQNRHIGGTSKPRWRRTSRVGMQFLPNLHRKFLTFGGTFSFQRIRYPNSHLPNKQCYDVLFLQPYDRHFARSKCHCVRLSSWSHHPEHKEKWSCQNRITRRAIQKKTDQSLIPTLSILHNQIVNTKKRVKGTWDSRPNLNRFFSLLILKQSDWATISYTPHGSLS